MREFGGVFSFPYYSNLILQIFIMSQNQKRNTNEEVQPPIAPNLQMQALIGEMRQMIKAELKQIHESWIG